MSRCGTAGTQPTQRGDGASVSHASSDDAQSAQARVPTPSQDAQHAPHTHTANTRTATKQQYKAAVQRTTHLLGGHLLGLLACLLALSPLLFFLRLALLLLDARALLLDLLNLLCTCYCWVLSHNMCWC